MLERELGSARTEIITAVIMHGLGHAFLNHECLNHAQNLNHECLNHAQNLRMVRHSWFRNSWLKPCMITAVIKPLAEQ